MKWSFTGFATTFDCLDVAIAVYIMNENDSSGMDDGEIDTDDRFPVGAP